LVVGFDVGHGIHDGLPIIVLLLNVLIGHLEHLYLVLQTHLWLLCPQRSDD
jgi:hypothetical protein